MDAVGWGASERPVVGVIDDDPADATAVAGEPSVKEVASAVVAEYGGSTLVEPPAHVHDVLAADPDFLVALGARSMAALVRTGLTQPVLAVGVDPAVDATPSEALSAALEGVLDGNAVERHHPLLAVEIGGEDIDDRALFDVLLETSDPARISEYAITSRGERLAQFRADGVIVATPVGTRGYAGAVSAPELSTAVDALAVSPIAPFVMHANRWVLPDDGLSISIERDEATVSVSVDGRTVATIGPETRVDLGVDGSLSTLAVPGIAAKEI